MKQALILIVTFIFGFASGQAQGTSSLLVCYKHNVVFTGRCSECIADNQGADTIASVILISHKSPSFGHGIDGYCVYKNDKCTGIHYKVWRKRMILIGPEYIIWGCKRRDKK